eukprot:tig00000042_g15395.t1
MATAFLMGVAVAGTAYGARFVLRAMQNYKGGAGAAGAAGAGAFKETASSFSSAFRNYPGTAGKFPGGFKSKMDREEAMMILGVSPSATAQEIKDAHRKAMLANHPDLGGSPFIASKVNEAKTVLLGRV